MKMQSRIRLGRWCHRRRGERWRRSDDGSAATGNFIDRVNHPD